MELCFELIQNILVFRLWCVPTPVCEYVYVYVYMQMYLCECICAYVCVNKDFSNV